MTRAAAFSTRASSADQTSMVSSPWWNRRTELSLPGREREVGATRCDQQEHDGDECSERSRHESLTAQWASANDQDQRVRCIDWLDVRAAFRGPGCADEGTLRDAIVR